MTSTPITFIYGSHPWHLPFYKRWQMVKLRAGVILLCDSKVKYTICNSVIFLWNSGVKHQFAILISRAGRDKGALIPCGLWPCCSPLRKSESRIMRFTPFLQRKITTACSLAINSSRILGSCSFIMELEIVIRVHCIWRPPTCTCTESSAGRCKIHELEMNSSRIVIFKEVS